MGHDELRFIGVLGRAIFLEITKHGVWEADCISSFENLDEIPNHKEFRCLGGVPNRNCFCPAFQIRDEFTLF